MSTGEFHPVLVALSKGVRPEALRLSRIDGRWDLRHLVGGPAELYDEAGEHPVPSPAKLVLKRVRLEGIDFRGANLDNLLFYDAVVNGCILDGASLGQFSAFGKTRFESCSFVGADLRGAGMGGVALLPFLPCRVVWDSCDFSRADLRDSAHSAELYRDCDFSGARLTRVEFGGSRHVRSVFAGVLRELSFRARDPNRVANRVFTNTMQEVDFSKCSIEWCSFWGLDLADARLPTDGHVLLKPKVETARSALAALRRQGLYDELVNIRVILEDAVMTGPDIAEARQAVAIRTLGEDDAERDRVLRLLESFA